MRIFEIKQAFEIAAQQLKELVEEYNQPDKIKGEVYRKRYLQLTDKMGRLSRKAHKFGTEGTIFKVNGTLDRKNKRNPKLSVTKKIEIYFVNVSAREVTELILIRFGNRLKGYSVEMITPGKIKSS